MMIYKPSKLIYSSVHIDRVYHFIRDHFSRIPLYTYISFNGPPRQKLGQDSRYIEGGRYIYIYIYMIKLEKYIILTDRYIYIDI